MMGAGVWLTYGALEFIFYSVIPMFSRPEGELNAPLWRAAGFLACAYLLIGGVLGAFTAWMLRSPANILRMTVLPLPVLYAVNLLLHRPLSGSELISVAIAAVLIAAILASLKSDGWRQHLGFLAGPLTASALLLMPTLISVELLAGKSNSFKFGMILAAFLMIGLIARTAQRLLPVEPTAPRLALYAAGMACLAGAAGWTLSPGNLNLPSAQTRSLQSPNVILIVMDTVRADHTSLYGYPRDTTPFLREFAKESAVYANTIAVSDMTLPTHASIFTGLYPRTHGAHFLPPAMPTGRPLDGRFITMAETLRGRGYRTMAVVANSAYLAPEFGLNQGFEVFDWRRPVAPNVSTWHPYLTNTVSRWIDRHISRLDLDLSVRRAGEINNAVDHLLDQTNRETPYFLFINYMDAHTPYSPPEPFRSAVPCEEPAAASYAGLQKIVDDVVGGKRQITAREQQCLTSQYDGSIAFMDSEMNRLAASLKARGQYENTLLVITSDHGESLGTRGHMGHGGLSVYQEQIGVPLVVKYPGNNPPAVVDALASQLDLLPTVLGVAAIATPSGLPGMDLRKLQGDSRTIVSISYPGERFAKLNSQLRRTEEALFYGGKKLVVSNLGKKEIFDLSHDRGEQNNLYRDGDPAAATLAAMFGEWNRSIPLDTRIVPAGTRGNVERLKSLGYVQ